MGEKVPETRSYDSAVGALQAWTGWCVNLEEGVINL